jgi:Tol biopolymer transport system component/DNA-binding winged helix-turn-helix (wHTH) protein
MVRFGPFDADLRTQELRKHGVRLRLPGQSFQVLKMLVERPGDLVTREEFHHALWPSDTFVDFDHGLSAAVNRLREALGDSADNPQLIETLPRRGYRFIGQLATSVPSTLAETEACENAAHKARSKALSRPQLATVSVVALVCVLAGTLAFFRWRRGAAIDVLPSVPFTALPGLEVAPSFSPDGAQIVFAWSPSSGGATSGFNFDLYVKSMGSENLRRLTNHPSQWITPAWSPGGSQIAFHRISKEDTGLYLIPAGGGAERKLRATHVSLAGASRISWSPDGKLIAFADSPDSGGHRRLQLLAVETLESTQVQHDEECQEEVVPAFSPDGHRLAYLCFLSSGEYAISVADSSGRAPKLLKKLPGWAWGLAWTANSQRLLLTQYQMGDTRNSLLELTLDGTTVRHFSFGKEEEDPEWPTISANGNRVAYDNLSGGHPSIFRRDLQNPLAPPVKLIASSRAQSQPVYSPDGKYIAFASNRGGASEIWMTDSDGDNPVQLTNLKSMTGTPNWSPDSQKIVFDSRFGGHAGLYIVGISERVPHKLVTNLADVSVPSWSHDGKWIYFIGGGTIAAGRIYRAPAVGGNATPLSALPGYGPVESFDGERVYYSTAVVASDDVAIFSASLSPTGTELPVEGLPPIFAANWTLIRDGIYFCPANPFGNVSFFDFATRHIHSVFEAEQAPLGLSVSPDGRYMLYSQVGEIRSDIMLVENFR